MSRHVGLRRGCALKSGTGVVGRHHQAGEVSRRRPVGPGTTYHPGAPGSWAQYHEDCRPRPGSQRSPDSMAVRVTTSTSRRSCRSDAARITTNTAIRIKAAPSTTSDSRWRSRSSVRAACAVRRKPAAWVVTSSLPTRWTARAASRFARTPPTTSTCTTTSNVGDANCSRSRST